MLKVQIVDYTVEIDDGERRTLEESLERQRQELFGVLKTKLTPSITHAEAVQVIADLESMAMLLRVLAGIPLAQYNQRVVTEKSPEFRSGAGRIYGKDEDFLSEFGPMHKRKK